MKKPLKVARRIGISLVGFPLLVIGIILIPLPGPGLVVCFLALLVLSTEFSWAQKYQEKIRTKLKEIYKNATSGTDKKQ